MDASHSLQDGSVQNVRARRRAGTAGIAIGALAGVLAVILAGTAVARLAPSTSPPVLEATHLPPLLVARGERVELRYDVFCEASEAAVDAPCKATGSVFVRSGDGGPFREIALRDDRAAANGRFVALVPDAIAHSSRGFSYYAVLRTAAGSITLPAGGAASPQRSLPLGEPVDVALGTHVFGRTIRPSSRVAEATWGAGPGQVGLEQGRNLTPIGGASFDVSSDGSVHVLDEANRRVLRWGAGAVKASAAVPLAINGTLADMSVAGDGTIHVLETTNGGRDTQVLRTFTAAGTSKGVTTIAGRAAQVRIDAAGVPMVLQQPSSQWMPAAAANGQALAPAVQSSDGSAARPTPTGEEVVVLRRGAEIRVSVTGREGSRRSWRITSQTPLAEVQLADVAGGRAIVVARVYSDTRDEFVVLVLGPAGLERRFALDSADWAETAPLSRFRVRGSALYQLGSTPERVFVDRFDLEVT